MLTWFIPAFAKSSVGSSYGIVDDDGQKAWPLLLKKSMYVSRTLFAVHGPSYGAEDILLVVLDFC